MTALIMGNAGGRRRDGNEVNPSPLRETQESEMGHGIEDDDDYTAEEAFYAASQLAISMREAEFEKVVCDNEYDSLIGIAMKLDIDADLMLLIQKNRNLGCADLDRMRRTWDMCMAQIEKEDGK